MKNLDPVELIGEGNYEVEEVKEVAITDDFVTLDEDSRKCQIVSTFEDCVTQYFLKALIDNCHCLPYNLQNYTLSAEVCK